MEVRMAQQVNVKFVVISPENFGPVELLFSTPRAGFLSTH
jgi:hypothetical protein